MQKKALLGDQAKTSRVLVTKNSILVGVKVVSEKGIKIIVTVDNNYMMRKWDLIKGIVIST